MRKYLLLIIAIVAIIAICPNRGETHGPGPWIGPGGTPGPSGGQAAPPPLSSEGILYDFIVGSIPQIIKEKVADTTGTISVNLFDPSKIGIELLNSYVTPFDPYQLTSVSSLNLPILNKDDIFKPAMSIYLRQHLILTILQTMVHVESCPEAPAAEYLIEIGQPSLLGAQIAGNVSPAILGANWVKDAKAGKRLADHVQAAIGTAAPQPPPEGQKPSVQLELMISRLIVEELGKDYYFPGNIDFAPYLRALGEDALPYIAQAAKASEHSLIRRNAVALLSLYKSAEARKALREILLDSANKDKVVRNRALVALIDKRDKEIVPFLLDTLKKGDDAYFKTFVAYAIGLLGDRQCVKPLMEYIDADPNNRDVLWAGISAIGMLGDGSDELKTYLKKFVEKKLLVTKTFAQLALYGLGDDSAGEQLSIQASENPFRKVEFPAQYFATKMMGKRGEKDIPALLALVNNREHDPRLRFAAMCQIKFTKNHIDALKELIAQPKMAPIIKAYALYNLYLFQDKDITTIAENLVKESLPVLSRKGVKLSGEGFDTVIALRILGSLKANKEPLLQETIAQIAEGIKARPPRDKDMGLLLPRPPLMETAATELSKLGSKEAARILLDFFKQQDFPGRPELATALGNVPPDKSTVKTLINALSDKDGWVRYRAYCSLKKLTGQDFACEWIYDSESACKQTANKWEKWWTDEGSKKY